MDKEIYFVFVVVFIRLEGKHLPLSLEECVVWGKSAVNFY